MVREPRNGALRAILIAYNIIVFIALCLYCILLITTIAHEISNDGRNSTITFQRRFAVVFTLLGIFCEIVDNYAFYITLLSLMITSALFMIFALSVYYEARDLIEQIKHCADGNKYDYLIFRYQSIETSTQLLEDYFSTLLLILFVSSIYIQFFMIRQLRNSQSMPVARIFNAISGTVMLTISTFVFIGGAALINSQLTRFRSASHKVGDLQQLQLSNSSAVKLLIFMLRLSNDCNYLTIGGIFVANRQNIILMSFLTMVATFTLFVIDEKCSQFF
ncbi:hypothetical protein Tcan_04925 [Toxocara canis]|uniref:Uncharacterized protein n=1 Tax=Toxocara canis TaxID=6265 RepID=A0A0B2VKZ4_TOXCA|nr:hypothetical protein Tcan_04925 [Toxocara canis]